MTTRMDILTRNYLAFKKDINLINDSYSHLFPDLEDIDIVDLLFFFNYTFKQNDDLNETIISLMKSNNVLICDAEYKKAFPMIKRFVEFLYDFQKL